MPDQMPVSEHERGLYGKYRVERVDGSSKPGGKHEDCFYFVLDLDHDPLALWPLKDYADRAWRAGFEELAGDLWRLLHAKGLEFERLDELRGALDLIPRGTVSKGGNMEWTGTRWRTRP